MDRPAVGVLLDVIHSCMFDGDKRLCICGSGALGRAADECAAPATTAMWPAVWHGGRPTGRRATTRRIDLSCSARARAAAIIMRESGRPPAGGGHQCGAALTGSRPAEMAAECPFVAHGKTVTDAATPGWRVFFLTGDAKRAHLFSC